LLFSFIKDLRVAIGSVWAITAPVADTTMMAVNAAVVVLCICFDCFPYPHGRVWRPRPLTNTCDSTIIPAGRLLNHEFVITGLPG